MRAFYRLSDKSQLKLKLPGATKRVCFDNFLDAFDPTTCLVTVLADNCQAETIEWLTKHPYSRHFRLEVTEYGNAGSLLAAIRMARDTEESRLDLPLYFVEDDYLHLPDSKVLLWEGLKSFEYVTLYDHPDKYTAQYKGGEECIVRKGFHSHWRSSISTCMTFATTPRSLQRDFHLWLGWLQDATIPADHEIFSLLFKHWGHKSLGVSIPGHACHTDLTYSGTQGEVMMEPWAIKMMIDEHDRQLDAAEKKNLKGLISVHGLRESMLGPGPLANNFETLTKMAAMINGLGMLSA